ncbi:MAG: hypothetical protein ACYCOU_01440 [Sulfobacillus sp.]
MSLSAQLANIRDPESRSGRTSWLFADTLDQDILFKVQEKTIELLDATAEFLGKKDELRRLAPFLYRRQSGGAPMSDDLVRLAGELANIRDPHSRSGSTSWLFAGILDQDVLYAVQTKTSEFLEELMDFLSNSSTDTHSQLAALAPFLYARS